jgi:hypothetical protein
MSNTEKRERAPEMNGRKRSLNKKSIEKALHDYVTKETGGKSFPTGWVLVASLAPPSGDTGRGDSYLTLSSDGLPVHTMMGLMELAQNDARNVSMLSVIAQSIEMLFGKDKDESS